MGGLKTIWKDRGTKPVTKVKAVKDGISIPNSTVWSGNLDEEKQREEERCDEGMYVCIYLFI